MIVPQSSYLLLYSSCVLLFITACNSAMEGFIEGGQLAKIENFPHSVYLYIVCKEHHVCGGSILTQHIILTAGHCFEQCLEEKDILAYAGSDNTEAMIVSDRITKFRIHQYYHPSLLLNDIALGEMNSALPLGKTIKRIVLARNFPGVMMARLAGWGAVNEITKEKIEKLKQVTQIIQPEDICRQVITLRNGMMCAKNSPRSHPSQGDSGSALISKNGVEIGLVSFRIPERKDVVIYTNVSYYYDWIVTHSRLLHCSKT